MNDAQATTLTFRVTVTFNAAEQSINPDQTKPNMNMASASFSSSFFRKPRGVARKRRDRHHSLNVGSMHPPQTQGKVQSAVRLALSGMYLLQASARTGFIDCQMTSKVPEEFILPIMTGLER